MPVWNGLTDEWHPTQSLCDMLTMREHARKPDHEIAFAFVGDARNNVAQLAAGRRRDDGHGRAHGRADEPCATRPEVVEAALAIAEATGARITHTDDPASGVDGVDFVYTDVWVSMGEPEDVVGASGSTCCSPYQVNRGAARQDRQPRRAVHALPAGLPRPGDRGRRGALRSSTGLDALEVTDEVFESEHSIVFDQAENRMHTIKAVMVATLGA